ncbi:MAG TPA: terpene cyclase/mutase family protein, partial [Microthrixaceae bacterium]|nr:terpene cyclase/mutase family protein [Microthrixaceae bacterium]
MTQVSRISRMKAAAVATTCAGLLFGATGALLGAGAAAPAPTPQVQPALSWLSAQLGANGGAMPAPVGATKDWGLTADAILAFVAAGQGSAPAAVTATDLLSTNVAGYTTWEYQGATIRDAGPTGKTVLTLRSMGRPAVAGGVDQQAALRSLMQTSGVQTGRFSDAVPGSQWDTSNGFGQALSMLGLALTTDGIPAQAVTFLAAQQCPAGGFRLSYGTTAGCTDDGAADTDASALAIMALLNATPRTPQLTAALQKGTQWLIGRQAPDGSFGGTGPTAGANTNSSGLVAQALRAGGFTESADRAAAWIATCCQLSTANATGTPASPNVGAIAYNPAGLNAALTAGITAQAGDQWRRSTTQAVLA